MSQMLNRCWMRCGRTFTRKELTTRRRRFRNARWPVDLEFAWRLWGTRRIIRHEICWRSLREINPLEIKMADERFLIVRLSSLGDVIFTLPISSVRAFFACGKHLRENNYTCVIDAQGLYKSALLAKLTNVKPRIGYSFSYAREG